MRDDLAIRVTLGGNPGNAMFMYLAAEKLQRELGFGTICNVNIEMFGIHIPDRNLAGKSGLHFRRQDESQTNGRLPIEAATNMCRRDVPAFIQIEGFCQHVDNLPSREAFDYDAMFRRPDIAKVGGREDELVISIRGGEILRQVEHAHYVQVPIEFYGDLINATGLKPVFFGQIGDNPYCDELRKRFPSATFRAGSSAVEDFDYIRQSKNILPSVSTFAWFAAWLSNADRIFLPLLGMLNPFQHPRSFFIPLGDKRYNYYQFPFHYWINIDEYLDTAHSIESRWQAIDENRLRAMVMPPRRTPRIEDLVKHLDVDFYASHDPDLARMRATYGDCALFNHYIDSGFREHLEPFRLDRGWYCRTYPEAAAALGRGEFLDEHHHFANSGAALGYRAKP